MQEVKKPKKPLIYYYSIVLIVLIVFNFLLMPWVSQQRIVETDYGTFMTMIEEKDIGQVQYNEEENSILLPTRIIRRSTRPALSRTRTLRTACMRRGRCSPDRSLSRPRLF